MSDSIRDELDIEGLRSGLLEHTRRALGRVVLCDAARILDIGCGGGLPTVELAQRSGCEVMGVDLDKRALEELRQRVQREGLDHRVHPICGRFPGLGIGSSSFDLIWEEGVFHLLDLASSLDECARLLRRGGWLVMLETDGWIDDNLPLLDDRGWALKERLPLPRGCWWERYYEPLAGRVARLRELGAVSKSDDALLKGVEREIAAVRRQPSAFDCSFAISRRR